MHKYPWPRHYSIQAANKGKCWAHVPAVPSSRNESPEMAIFKIVTKRRMCIGSRMKIVTKRRMCTSSIMKIPFIHPTLIHLDDLTVSFHISTSEVLQMNLPLKFQTEYHSCALRSFRSSVLSVAVHHHGMVRRFRMPVEAMSFLLQPQSSQVIWLALPYSWGVSNLNLLWGFSWFGICWYRWKNSTKSPKFCVTTFGAILLSCSSQHRLLSFISIQPLGRF